uniref:Two component transcriptional regulator, LuxR family n=1 Tax=Geobacter sp. (strain M21) TaxID=443144 RepID=C6E836_GEOSM
MGIRIVLADDHAMFREGMRALLEREEDMVVVAEAGDGVSVVEMTLEAMPDIVVLDLSMPGMKGIEAASIIHEKAPGVGIIILSMHNDRQYIIEALKQGVKSFILKEWAFQELITAVRFVYNDSSYLSPRLSDIIISGFADEGKNPCKYSLTPREEQAYRLLVVGKNCKEIAYELNISSKTVETYRLKIMKKLNLSNIAQLVNHAVQEGIVGRRALP